MQTVRPLQGSLDGEEWHYPDVIKAINKLEPDLPHLKPVLVTFFKCAAKHGNNLLLNLLLVEYFTLPHTIRADPSKFGCIPSGIW